MAGIPYYLITSCCDQRTSQAQFIIPGGGIVTNGVYVFNGISFQEGTTGMWFYSGFCYQVEYLGTDFSTNPSAFNQADISEAIGGTCASSDCAACGIALPPAFSVYNCCDAANVVNLNINTEACSVIKNGTWVYNGAGYSTDSGFVFVPGECYNFTTINDGIYENGPDCTEFNMSTKSCKTAQLDGDCPACDLGLQYLAFRSCCGPTTILFKGIDANSYYGIREYLGTLVDGLENICYSIVIGNVGDETVPDLAAYNALPNPPAFIETVTFNTLSSTSTDCEAFTSSCPSCFPPPCYTLYNCAGESFNTTIDLSAYTNTWILITNYADSISGPYLVIENTGECKDAVNTISFANTASPCQSKCYEATGEGEITYVNDTYNLVTIYSPAKFCSYIYPTVSPGIVLTQGGNCTDYGQGMQCPEICYALTNCQTGEVIHSNTQSLEQYYLTTSVVTLNGYEGCWNITHGGDCSCAVPVTVLTSFETCQECLPVVAYQFTNCQNPAIVLYSSENYSDVLGFSVLLNCDTECYIVTQINFKPPVESSITILATYNNCVECSRTYFKLEDCAGIEPDVYTYTDLSGYVNNVIKIKDCDTCWQVLSIPFLPTGINADIVLFESNYEDCLACLVSSPCVCSRITNTSNTSIVFQYFDCNGTLVNLRVLDPGQTSNKICLIAWTTESHQNSYIEYFGECTESNGSFTCPVPKFPPRIVKPGYNTPACDAEKWDKITCNASEILYKSVLKGRYGISNCCDAPDDKWLIKKELIDLAALVDPNYICVETSCGCPPSSCECGCGSAPKTCNSN